MTLNRSHDTEQRLAVTLRLGRAELTAGQLAELESGGMIRLDQAAGDPVEVLVDGQPIAQGELVVMAGKFGVRIGTMTAAPDSRAD